MIREFETSPEFSGSELKWHRKISIDMSWVASASPYMDDATSICMCGSSVLFAINTPYPEFMELWMKAKHPIVTVKA